MAAKTKTKGESVTTTADANAQTLGGAGGGDGADTQNETAGVQMPKADNEEDETDDTDETKTEEAIKLPANLSLANADKYAGKGQTGADFFREVCMEVGAGDPSRFPALGENGIAIMGLETAAADETNGDRVIAQATLKKLIAVFERAQLNK